MSMQCPPKKFFGNIYDQFSQNGLHNTFDMVTYGDGNKLWVERLFFGCRSNRRTQRLFLQRMDTASTIEQSSGRIERRIAFATNDIEWLGGKDDWEGIPCIGAVNTRFSISKGETGEWHYYMSSHTLTASRLGGT
jgi:hypothetical protein